MDCQQQMMLFKKIQEMQFVAIELHLYLDTHPCDQDALNDYNCAVEMLNKLMSEYEEEFGSLLAHGFHGRKEWNWIEGPWPWEMSY
ncbi:spore coat protein CotJB [Anaeroselena agilis]|uniref:Spore coat protein CotJB n=1 Tax=Anaeroselena agilis TaxID=3063788 RepID=A0ABU3P4S7_9FIRM|nr:spore coat protein CotJB [Selenomonadales bacterium 4137-cl]